MRTLPLLLLLAVPLRGETLILKRAWIEQFKDRATIDASFTIDHAHKHPNAPAADGDMHVAGRAPNEIGLPMVAELMNAAGAAEQPAVQLIHAHEGNGQAFPLTGAWRLWFEHPAAVQRQFDDVPAASNTNPDHSFEIHPITSYAGQDVTFSLDFVQGFPAHDARTAFGAYEAMSIALQATDSAVSMDVKKAGYNYAVFRMKLLAAPVKLDDGGLAALADVLDNQGTEESVLASNIRMIFVPNTGPWKLVSQGAGEGSEFDALGIPRVNLNAVSAFLDAANGASATRKLPYEMIVVGLHRGPTGSNETPLTSALDGGAAAPGRPRRPGARDLHARRKPETHDTVARRAGRTGG